ncbi:hypothetical protein AB1Y20_012782 [Prymnesium parvum]|uniref:Glycylpeptide N-tetradecanoyltransferase n=1 Tax=Prymnesium parvum TaxID=97485 RepID=A0AB34IIV6_PRYPA
MLPLLLVSISLPRGLEWRSLRPRDGQDIDELHALLAGSYVSSDEQQMRIVYSKDSLRWILGTPGTRAELQLGISCSGELVAFVSAIPCTLRVYGKRHTAVEVTLLCVRRDWRRRGLTPLLLAELRRRGAELGVRDAIYTIALPLRPAVLRVRTYHLMLQPQRLLECGFWQPSAEELKDLLLKEGGFAEAQGGGAHGRGPALPSRASGFRVRRMQRGDCRVCLQLLRAQDKPLVLTRDYSPSRFRQRFVGRLAGAAGTRSLVATRTGRHGDAVVGFVSFTLVPLHTERGDIVQAQLLGYAAEGVAPRAVGEVGSHSEYGAKGASIESVESADHMTVVRDLLAAALHEAHRCGAHVFNALALAELTPSFFQSLGFACGDADTFFYLEVSSNTQMKRFNPEEVGWLPT